MTPTFSAYFKALYYTNTYLPPCDLSEQALSKHLLEAEDPRLAATAQRLISQTQVQKVLSETLSYDLEFAIPQKNQTLRDHDFTLLSSKPDAYGNIYPFYSVIEHNDLPGWVIKSGANRVPENFHLSGPLNNRHEKASYTKEESILRLELAKRITQVAQKNGLDIIVPKKKLVKYANSENPSDPCRTYCVLSQKVNILTLAETVQVIKSMTATQQIETAQKICSIIKKIGFVDASFSNIRLTPDGKIAFIDTEPSGLLVAQKPGLWNRLFPPKGSSVEKCARIGLYSLLHQTSRAALRTGPSFSCEPGLEAFREEVQSQYDRSAPSLSKWKIGLSIASLGLIPVINAIVSLVATIRIRKAFEKMQKIDTAFESIKRTLPGETPDEQRRQIYEYRFNRSPIEKQFLALTEGIPY
ncbi:MAG: hypothetical protein PVI40_00765 [Chlamydiota bacterium]|jgi:hypothetical protein